MGQSQGKLTPLQCMLNHFKDFRHRAKAYGALVTPFDLQRFCQLDWLTFGVGWPSEGSFNLQTAFRVRGVVYGNLGHPDQIPYIDVWIDVVSDAPKYLQNCSRVPVTVMAAIPQGLKKPPPVLQGPPSEDDWYPPPYHGDGSGRPPPERPEPPVTRSRGRRPPSPDSTSLKEPVSVQAPLKVIPGGGGEPTVIYSPFSTSDLYNWKLQTPSFSEKPQGLTSLLESIFLPIGPLGMIVSSFCRFYSPLRKKKGFCGRQPEESRTRMGCQQQT
ncbi:uncharacterized protein LOC120604991 [Pteropus medius]|uniref:uncharacterized protein LOC120604991 n=1 Tax=Pteropus vampyrus TaxID=132908 RepID=UPI00196A9559|nr:uncharacterized protein LOC120604991 [Pteropus giganteus]